ncbi:hypothetical protein AM571_CH01523 [Rhizobium etli 8C-3]|uniref:Uncharacterized protein n=1 Tax=Rhizobium etli 8C-3 TaxID=538025 RepID=A0A1L5P2J4_RHIET|nr:hypothetical protein AM571_CH01523 [Rhizobium etli 8C-3]
MRCGPLKNYIAMRINEKLATNIAMEVNAAISRIMSVIWLSFTRYVSNLFRYCSVVNRNRFRMVNGGAARELTSSPRF